MTRLDLCDTKTWLAGLRDDVGQFMDRLQVLGEIGRFRPSLKGACGTGEKATLSFSCFGVKIYYTLGLWDTLPPEDQMQWVEFLRNFQILDKSHPHHSSFTDHNLLAGIAAAPDMGMKWYIKAWLRGEKQRDPRVDAINGETKQTIATLAQVGASPFEPFYRFPTTKKELIKWLKKQNWSNPWSAGAQTAGMAVFLRSQGPLLETVDEEELICQTGHFIETMVDSQSGCYYQGDRPERGRLINGAMKVLNALDWLEIPIHHPEKLIDTCLEQGPPAAGCHVVDWLYVVHRCFLQTNHRLKEAQTQCLKIIKMIRTHQCTDLGFSYEPHKAQSSYYGATISKGLNEGDIHGTCL